MFNKKTIIILLIITNISVSISGKILEKIKARKKTKSDSKLKDDIRATGKYEDQKVAKAPKLTPDQIEFSKNLFKNINEVQKNAEAGYPLNTTVKGMKVPLPNKNKNNDEEDKPLRAAPGDIGIETTTLSHEGVTFPHKIILPEGFPKFEDPVPLKAGKKTTIGPTVGTTKASSQTKVRIKRAPPNQPSPGGGVATYKSVPSGGAILFDSFTNNLFPLGDPYGGLPDSMLSMGKWCIEVFIKGALSLAYSIIRWPHKIISKLMLIVSFVTWVPNTLMWCINPYIMMKFIAKSKLIHKSHEQLAELQYKLKVRLANTIDKIQNLKELVRQVCCQYWWWKKESIAVVEKEEAKQFLETYFKTFIGMHIVVFCSDLTEDCEACQTIQWLDDEPVRVIPRGPIPLWMEFFAVFW